MISVIDVKDTNSDIIITAFWGCKGCASRPSWPRLLHFQAVFGKIGQIVGWHAPPGFAPPWIHHCTLY